tara:strand:+ start:106 stop:969 length:864 start_codon:yes stop_codon:yes gene_type:complete
MAKKNYTVQKGILNYHPSGDKKIVSGVPVQWQSKPNEPTTELAYITDKEKELLKTLNLHDKDEEGHRRLMAEMNRGPGGILSLDDSGGAGPGGGDGGEGSDADGPGIGSGAESGGAPGSGGEADAGDADSGVGGGAGAAGSNAGPASWAPAFFSFNPNPNPNAMTGQGFTGPTSTSTTTDVAGFLSDLFSPVPDVRESITGFNPDLGTLADAMEAANPPSDPNPLGIIGDDDSEGGIDYLYEPILQAPQAAPTLLNPVPSAMRPQYEFKRNWWEGNKFVPAPITRIN